MSSIPLRHVLFASALLASTACTEALDEPDLGVADEEIVNGQTAPAGFFREVAYVTPALCSGTLIGARSVLTAAHCVAGRPVASLGVQLDGQGYAVVRAVVHANYASNDDFDLAVLTLDRAAPLAPVRIDHDNLAHVGDSVTLVGFGITGQNAGGLGTKRWGTNVIDDETPIRIRIFGVDDGHSMICHGDSGGPAFRGGRQVGVHRSMSSESCTGWGYITRVWAFRAWIEDRAIYPYADANAMVSQQYLDFLGRAADASGRAYWAGRLQRGELEAENVVANFLRSPEFAGTSAPIIRLYLGALGRLPDSGGFYYWLGRHRGGTSIASIADQLGALPEFQARYGALSNGVFVARAYQDTLGRTADLAGLSYWTGRLNAGTITRAGVVNGLAQSSEAVGRFRIDVDLAMAYLGMLRRSPDSAGFNHWKTEMQAGRIGLDALIKIFYDGREYAQRFGGS